MFERGKTKGRYIKIVRRRVKYIAKIEIGYRVGFSYRMESRVCRLARQIPCNVSNVVVVTVITGTLSLLSGFAILFTIATYKPSY